MEIFGIIILIVDIIAIINVLRSGASTVAKLLWTLAIIILPVLGAIAWFLVGPKSGDVIA